MPDTNKLVIIQDTTIFNPDKNQAQKQASDWLIPSGIILATALVLILLFNLRTP